MINSIDFATLVTIFISLVISITLHEAMHAFTGHWLGDDTAEREGRISLNPIRHIDPFTTILLPMITLALFHIPLLAAKPVPFNPNRVKFDEFGAALVGIAGPLTNLLLAISTAGVISLVQNSVSFSILNVLAVFLIVNVGLFIFNMIPIPPLDGSRVLYAFAPEPVQDFMASLERSGIIIIFAIVLFIPAFGEWLGSVNTTVVNFLIS